MNYIFGYQLRFKYWLTACLLISLLACDSQTKMQQKVIHFAIAQAPQTLDPRFATDAASERVNRLIYQRLVEFDESSKVIPSLAEWQMRDAKQYRFTLKAHALPFHHHQALTAQDVKATYDSVIALKRSPHAAEFSNIARIDILDARTIDFYLKKSDSHFAEKLIIGILPHDLIAKNHDFSRAPIGNGKLKLISWQNGLWLERVADQQRFQLIEVKDPTVRVLKLLRGEADLLQGDLPPELVKYLQKQVSLQVNTSYGANFSYLGLNMQDPLLKQIEVRQAIAHAINRQAIISQVMVNQTREAGAILPPEHYAGNASLLSYRYDPILAKQLLREAGLKLPLKLVYKTSTDAQRVRIATILQAQMADAGIDLEIRSLDWGTFFDDVKQGKFQLFGLTWVGIKTPDIYAKAFGSGYFPPDGFNRGHYSDAVLDTLLQQENWQAATQRIHAALPYIPLWYEGQFAAFTHHLSDYVPKPDGNWDGLATLQFVN